MPRSSWGGRRATAALRWVLTKYERQCWLCHHGGANSLDHVQPASIRPDLEWEPSNWRAAHLGKAGRPKGCQHPGCRCPGNAGRKAKPWTSPPSRAW